MENSPFIATEGVSHCPFWLPKGIITDSSFVKFHPAPSRHTWGTAAGAPAASSQPCLHQSMRWKKTTIPRSWSNVETVVSPSLPGMSLDPPKNHPKQLGFPTIRERGRSCYRDGKPKAHLKSHLPKKTHIHTDYTFPVLSGQSLFWIIIARGCSGRQQQIENHQANSGPNLWAPHSASECHVHCLSTDSPWPLRHTPPSMENKTRRPGGSLNRLHRRGEVVQWWRQ